MLSREVEHDPAGLRMQPSGPSERLRVLLAYLMTAPAGQRDEFHRPGDVVNERYDEAKDQRLATRAHHRDTTFVGKGPRALAGGSGARCQHRETRDADPCLAPPQPHIWCVVVGELDTGAVGRRAIC